MGIYLNPGADGFQQALNSEIYVDKTGMLSYLNRVIGTEQKYVCVSRPRRFGKSMAANMVSAYYDRTVDGRDLFQGLEIAGARCFLQYLNKYDVINVNMQEFLSGSDGIDDMLSYFDKSILWDLTDQYQTVRLFDETRLARSMKDIYQATERKFVIVIDEWDCIFREYKDDSNAQRKYLDFLRTWLKDQPYVGLVYMTGILPIKKYGTHSALNMFSEFSMTEPGSLKEYVGFTAGEVAALCKEYHMPFDGMKDWYDGYHFRTTDPNDEGRLIEDVCVYNPRSVIMSLVNRRLSNYWNQTETYEALRFYIDMNFEGLKDDIIAMLSGDRIRIDARHFTNDMVTFDNKDDVLTLLVHLGYLAYDFEIKTVRIPNKEISDEFITSVTSSKWETVSDSIKDSENLLQAIWEKDAAAVAKGIEKAHFETSILQYNDENALSYTISLALYAARNYYTFYRELPAGRGFADLVFLPKKKYTDRPAIVAELKWEKEADTAIKQIKEKKYCQGLEEYAGNILLVGVSYDKKTKKHKAVIEIA